MAESILSSDSYSLKWQVVKESPTLSEYILAKAPFVLILMLVLCIPMWLYVDSMVGVITALFVILISWIILFFLSGVDRDEVIVFEISGNGIMAGQNKLAYAELDKPTTITYLQQRVLPAQQWEQKLDKNNELLLGKLSLYFVTQKTRQQAIQSLLHYLGA